MKYVSIDIETSGLDSTKHQILSIGAIIEDTEEKLPFDEIPTFNAIVVQRDITGSPYALNLNKGIIELMGKYLEDRENLEDDLDYIFLEKDEVVIAFYRFLFKNGLGNYEFNLTDQIEVIDGVSYPTIGRAKSIPINVAGKNFGTFDKLFLEKLPRWKQLIKVRQRILDPAILHCMWSFDEKLPSLNECKVRSGIRGQVTHNALEDAKEY